MVGTIRKFSPFFSQLVCLGLVMLIALFLMNRAFSIGACAGIGFLFFAHKKVRLNKLTLALSAIVLFAIVIGLAAYLKSDSSLGRIFIYKISWTIFLEHPFTGIGWGNFERDYDLYQADYFSHGNFTQKEFLLAGNTFYAFNDYWEVIVETGLIGFCALLFFIYLVIKLTYLRLSAESNTDFLKLLIALMTVVAVAALFTHVFEHKPFKIGLFFFLTYIIFPKNTTIKSFSIIVLALIFSFSLYGFEIKNIANYNKLVQAKTLIASGFVLEGQKLFSDLYPKLKSDVGFLKDYNDALAGTANADKKIFLLKKILTRHTDHITYLNLANIYLALGLNSAAENAYLKAVHIVPNRFVPKEALFNFYIKTKQFNKATYYRNLILSMPIKVPSARVQGIIQTVKNNQLLSTL